MDTQTDSRQLTLWTQLPGGGAKGAPLDSDYPATPKSDTPLGSVVYWFQNWLYAQGKSANTVESYVRSAALLTQHLGPRHAIGSIEPRHLRSFLVWVQTRRKTSPATVELRGYGVRSLFAALVEAGSLTTNPAIQVFPPKTDRPLPQPLFDNNAAALRQQVAQRATAGDADDAASLRYLIVSLALDLGLRRGEISRLTTGDVDLSNPLRPVVHVRYPQTRHRHKRRSLLAPPDFGVVYQRYIDQVGLQTANDRLFSQADRTLARELGRVTQAAGVSQEVTFSVLRWTYAVAQLRSGVTGDALRQRLGLSPRNWEQAEVTLQQLTKPVV